MVERRLMRKLYHNLSGVAAAGLPSITSAIVTWMAAQRSLSPCVLASSGGGALHNLFVAVQVVKTGRRRFSIEGIEVVPDLVGVVCGPNLGAGLPAQGGGKGHQTVVGLVAERPEVVMKSEQEERGLGAPGEGYKCGIPAININNEGMRRRGLTPYAASPSMGVIVEGFLPPVIGRESFETQR